MKRIFIVLLLISLPVWASARENEVHPSPDGKLKAWVIPVGKKEFGFNESRIEIRDAANALLFSKSHGSEDGEHGLGVVHASWTPDSQFFVYSASSSGGHQSWHFPTYFYSRVENGVQLLDDYTGPITESKFAIKAPDVISTAGRQKADLEEAVFEVSLRDLRKKERKR